jgi:hypothetical protein
VTVATSGVMEEGMRAAAGCTMGWDSPVQTRPLPSLSIASPLKLSLEMPLEHAAGQASSTSEHGDRLIQHLFKAHDTFSSHTALFYRWNA